MSSNVSVVSSTFGQILDLQKTSKKGYLDQISVLLQWKSYYDYSSEVGSLEVIHYAFQNLYHDFLEAEGDEMLLLRLEALCEDKCDHLALKLAAAYVKHMNVSNIFNKYDVNQINDIVLVLMYKYDKTQEIIEKVKMMRLEDGLELLRRFDDHCKSPKRIWKYSDKVIEIASHTILASAMVKVMINEGDHKLLFDLISQWALIHIPKFLSVNSMTPIENMVRKMIKTAGSSLHVYIFTKVLRKQFGEKVKTLCVELYIRALTANMNEIEQQKVTNDVTKINEVENILADGFLQLGEFLNSNKYVCRECLLTSFSIKPTAECFEKIKAYASEHNNNPNDTSLGALAPEQSSSSWHKEPNRMTSSQDSTNNVDVGLNLLDSELSGLAPHLADDLSTVLSGPRCQLLSWSMGWTNLLKECEKYMAEYNSSRHKNKELKYLNLDYSLFKDWPSQNVVSTGIEKGYEHLVDAPKVKRKRKKLTNSNANKTAGNKKETGLTADEVAFDFTLTSSDSESSQFPCTTGNSRVQKQHQALNDRGLRKLELNKHATSTSNARSGPSEFNCTTPVSKMEDQTKWNLKQPCNVYSKSSSPIPAEVPPTALSDNLIKNKFIPILQSLNLNPKVLLTDILSLKKQPAKETSVKRDPPDREKLDILAQAVMRSDILLAKSVPGMNSLDMIIPQPQETTVQVVQISSSTNSLLTQSVSNSGVSQPSNSAHSRSKSNSDSMSDSSRSQNSSNQTIETNPSADGRPVLYTVQSGQSVVAASHSSIATTVSDQNLTSAHILLNNSPAVTTRIQTAKPNLSTQTVSSDQLAEDRSGEGVELSGGLGSQSETAGTHVTSHIQSVGQPQKIKLSNESNCANKNSTLNSSSSQTNMGDEAHKTQTNPVYRLVVKDGRVIEQYFQTNQPMDPVLSIPDTAAPENTPVSAAQTYNQNQFIKLLNKKKEFKTKEELLAHKVLENELLTPSLPKFHHVFGRQKYQSGPAIPVENTNVMSSQTQFDDNLPSGNDKSEVRSTTPLSKGVQTISKEADNSSKSLPEKLRSDASAQVVVPSTSVQSDSSSSSASTGIKETRATEVQPSSGVIFTCKVPISISNSSILQGKPVTILKATSTADVIIPNTKIETEIRNKDSVIRSNMNALLAAALQSNPPIKHTVINNSNSTQTPSNVKHIKIETTKNSEVLSMSKVRMPTPAPKTFRRHPLVQQGPSRFVRPILQASTGNSMTQTGPPVVTIPLPARTVVLATNLNQNSLSNLSKIETRREQINTDQSVSSTTLEQLREFESVLEQVTNTSQMKERGNVNMKNEHNVTHTPENADFSQNTSKVNTMFQSSIVSTISDLNSERVSLTFISKASSANTTNSTVTLATSNAPKITTNTPVVVVQSCSRPLASPALSIASQSSSSPAPQTPPSTAQSKITAKINKPKTKSSVGKTAPTTTLKVSTLPKPQQKPQEDEQTTQRIYAILDKYAEQLRNSPELKNKPAPRRRSNPPTNPTQSSKRKKSSQNKSKSISNLPSCSGLEMSPGSEDLRTLGSEDSSNGVSQLSQMPNSPQSKNDEHSNPPGGDVSSETSESLDAKDQRSQHRILLTEPSNTSRTVLVQENLQPMINVEGTKVLAGKQLVVGSGATVPLTLSLPVAGNVKQVIFPVPADGRFVVAKGPKMYRVHQVTMPSGSPLLATAGSGAVVLRQMCLNKSNSTVKQVKLPVVSQIPSQNLANISTQPTVVLPSGSQSFTLSTGSGIETESLGIALDNTILLNTSTASSLGFFQRNVSKSGQHSASPNVFTNSKPSCSQEHASSTFSANSELSGSHIKNEPSASVHANTDTIKKRVNISSQCDDFKPKTEEIQFSISGEAEKLVSSTNFIATSAKNWTQMLKDVKEDMIVDSQGNKKLVSETLVKKEFSDDKGSDLREPHAAKEGKVSKPTTHSELLKQKKMDEGSSFREERSGSHETQCTKIQALPNHSSGGHQWQFNVGKLDKGIIKDIKTSPLSPCVQDNKTQTIIQSSGPMGLKRKMNVENTIFQVAFKRSDRLKVSKDEFMHQRNSALSLERELRLQKSLSEECEDLGVDKPSTSDLFPEAELLLDSDPLSRDSLQELYSRGMESSSSSHDSPNRCSPPVLSDMVANRYSSSWRKQKKDVKRSGSDNLARDNVGLNKDCRLDQKSDSSCEDGPINGASASMNTSGAELKTINSSTLVYKTTLQSNKIDKNRRLECDQQHSTVTTLNLGSHDSDNFSEGEPNCNDILDTEGDSDGELPNSCKHPDLGEMNVPLRENDVDDKIDANADKQSPNMLSCGNCTYTYQNYMHKSKSHEESNLPWFHMVKSQHRNDADEEELRKSNLSRSSIVWRTPDSIVEEIRRNDSPKEHSSENSDLVGDQSVVKNSKHSVARKEEEIARGKKRKKIGMYVSSGGEDSGSSLDNLLEETDDGIEIDRLSRRAQPRRSKKGCPCFNGNQDATKKKKEITGGSGNKTEKACSAPKPASYHSNTTKKASKPVVKNVNKKR